MRMSIFRKTITHSQSEIVPMVSKSPSCFMNIKSVSDEVSRISVKFQLWLPVLHDITYECINSTANRHSFDSEIPLSAVSATTATTASTTKNVLWTE